jgi:Flp pilus assembly protein TadG
MNAARREAARGRRRGATAVMFALVLTFLLVLVALVVDVGHFWVVRAELQNAADASSLAGVRDLNGTSGRFALAVQSAQAYASENRANGTVVVVPGGDVTLGSWDFSARTFTPTLTPPNMVDAMRVTTRRTAATGDPVTTFFAPILGIGSQDVTATAIAVTGGPGNACGFTLALPDCGLYDAAGNLNCGAPLVFNSGNNNVAFTLLTLSNPNTPDIECAMARALHYPTCPKNCDCASACLPSAVLDQIRISNGNNFSNQMITIIQWAIANTPGGLYLTLPVIRTGQTQSCQGYALSNVQAVAGYVLIHVTDATGPPNKGMTTAIDCSHTSPVIPGGGFFGLTATKVYLAR